MDRAYEEAFAEIDEIFKIMPIDLLSKIPAQFRQMISENRARDYEVRIQEQLEEKILKKETIAILGLIYRDFLASPEERDELQKRDAEELDRIEKENAEQYDIENVFSKRKNKQNEDSENSTELVVYEKKGFFRKIIKFFKNFFIKK